MPETLFITSEFIDRKPEYMRPQPLATQPELPGLFLIPLPIEYPVLED